MEGCPCWQFFRIALTNHVIKLLQHQSKATNKHYSYFEEHNDYIVIISTIID